MRGFCLGALLLSAAPALAEPLYNTPLYDQASKSYFEMVDTRGRVGPNFTKANGLGSWSGTWGESQHEAATLTFHSVHGRLALVTSVETHEFLEAKFQPDTDVWIGYRYDCGTKRLMDSTGHDASRQSFQPWDKNWKQDVYFCTYNQYEHGYTENGVPVYGSIAYSPLKAGFTWIAKGWHKGYDAYFVEFPTGKP